MWICFFSLSILGSNEPPRKSVIQSHSHSHSWNHFSLSISESFQNCLICSFWLEIAIQSVGPSVRLSVREFVLLIIYFWYIVSGFSFFWHLLSRGRSVRPSVLIYLSKGIIVLRFPMTNLLLSFVLWFERYTIKIISNFLKETHPWIFV